MIILEERKCLNLKLRSSMKSTEYKLSGQRIAKRLAKDKFLYILLLPSVILTLMFSYFPIGGVKMAFQDYNIYNPSMSQWIGLTNFKKILETPGILTAIWNTLYISLLNLFICFPITVIFALLLNEVQCSWFKRFTQTVSYLPHFLSWISVIGIATAMYSKYGFINDLIVAITGNPERTLFMAEQSFFVPNVILLNIWKGTGWGSIVFLAAITGVDQSLYEAATVDGANRFKQIQHVTFPAILPTIVIMVLWRVGSLLSDNFELIYGLQNTYVNFEVIQTTVYKEGIQAGNYSISTALGFGQGLINFIVLFIVNMFAKKTTGTGLF